MTKLTDNQTKFLKTQGIPLSRVFDATGMKPSEYKPIMKDLGMDVAIGVTPCKEVGHTLRIRGGHCLQCGTHNLAFLRRYSDEATIYAATSTILKLTKIGTAKDASKREYSLNNSRYGDSNDWKIQFTQQCPKAGRIEFEVHQALMPFNVSRSYWKQGNLVDCEELFDCNVELAIATIKQTISK
jgi:hypothetical protein